MKTLIAVPCMDMNPVAFTHSLALLEKEGDCTLSMLTGSLIYESRNKLSKQAIKMGADYILWLDSDVVFPPDTLKRMLKHMEEGKEIVSGLYFRRAGNFAPTIFKSYKDEGEGLTWENYDDYPKDSVFEIAGCGFGCVMLKTEILLDLALNYREWFQPVKNCGEDISFCYRARELGHKIWCDSTLKCGHVGYTVIDESVWHSSAEVKEK